VPATYKSIPGTVDVNLEKTGGGFLGGRGWTKGRSGGGGVPVLQGDLLKGEETEVLKDLTWVMRKTKTRKKQWLQRFNNRKKGGPRTGTWGGSAIKKVAIQHFTKASKKEKEKPGKMGHNCRGWKIQKETGDVE